MLLLLMKSLAVSTKMPLLPATHTILSPERTSTRAVAASCLIEEQSLFGLQVLGSVASCPRGPYLIKPSTSHQMFTTQKVAAP